MKKIKEFLQNQNDLALTMMANEMGADKVNLVLVKHWLDRSVAVQQMLKELE